MLSRLSGAHQSSRQVRSAAVLGALGFELLKVVGAFLIVRTTQNPVYAAFGVVVGLLIWINLVGQLLMVVAAWGATALPLPPVTRPTVRPPSQRGQ
jgi:membrane protein